MALTHLADTSVLKRLGRSTVRAVVADLAKADRLARTSIGDLEMGYSARNEDEWDQIIVPLTTFPLIEIGPSDVARALQVQRMLAARSQRGRRLPDLLIAAAAEANGLTVLHYDTDFDRIAEVTGQQAQWVVPAGSVD